MSDFKPRFRTLVGLFDESTRRHAARPLFGTKAADGTWGWQTYGEFRQMVDKLRSALSAAGIEAGDRVAIIANNRVEWAVGAYATYTLGAAWVPMYEAQQDKEWAYILNDCGAKAVFASTEAIARRLNELKADLPELKHVFCFDAPASDPQSFPALLAKGDSNGAVEAKTPEEGDIAGYIYTSGTTGTPKGVLLTHANFAYNVSAALDIFPIEPEHRSLSFLPWAHSFGQTAELHTLIGAGASMGICEGVPKIIDNLAEVRPTILMAVPNIFNRIYDSVQKQMAGKPAPIRALFEAGMTAQSRLKNNEPLTIGQKLALPIAKKIIFSKILEKFGGRLQFAISGGAALSRDVGEFVDNLGILVFEGYGLTETSPVAAANSPTERRIGSVGKPLPGITIKIDQEASEDSTDGEGEIIIYGHNVMKGYYQLPEENAEIFTEDGGLRTGDLGKIDKDGFIFVTGRIKELYKLENGKYVAPGALEEKLDLSPYIARTMVFGANKRFNVAIVVPDFINLGEYAQANGIDASTPGKLVENEKIKALIKAEIDKQSAGFKGFETIRKFHLVNEEFSVENNQLTPKLSMKRRNIIKRYEAEIDAMYAD